MNMQATNQEIIDKLRQDISAWDGHSGAVDHLVPE